MIDFQTFANNIQTSIELLRTALPSVSDQLTQLSAIVRNMQVYDGATAALIRQSLLSGLARSIANTEFKSHTEAETALEQLIPLFDAELAATDEYTAFEALRALRAALVNDITTRGLRLPDLVSVSYKTPLPAIVIAHDLYLDATRADEITLRNDPVHPLFCGMNLEVLSS